MGTMDLVADSIKGGADMMALTLGDFSDSDMLVRPVPGANHAAWQLGHVITSEARMGKMLNPEKAVELPAGFAEKFTKETAKSDDVAAFPKKAELLEQLTRVRGASCAIIRSMSEADLSKPTPGPMGQRFPTLSHVALGLIPSHATMHLGQMQVIRRKLGKPVLF